MGGAVRAVSGERWAIDPLATPKGFRKRTGAPECWRAACGAPFRLRTAEELLADDHRPEAGPTGVRGYWDHDIRFHTSENLAPAAVPAIGASPHGPLCLPTIPRQEIPYPVQFPAATRGAVQPIEARLLA